MKDCRVLEVVTERDVDLMILEELNVCPEFAAWWIVQVTGTQPHAPKLTGAYHSVAHPVLGESDFLLIYADVQGTRQAILVENKIDAATQPNQAGRYRQRGEAGVAAGDWQRYTTCMFAPARYIESAHDPKSYDSVVTYEQVRDWFRAHGSSGSRGQYRAQVLDTAIEQNRRGYQPQADERVTRFWHAYWQCATQEFPELEMPEPAPKPAGSSWIEFRPSELGSGRRIYHKLDKGYVDLQVDGVAQQVSSIAAALGPLLGRDTQVVTTGKSASVRVDAPPVDRFADFDSQRNEARAGMRAAYRLLIMSRAIASSA